MSTFKALVEPKLLTYVEKEKGINLLGKETTKPMMLITDQLLIVSSLRFHCKLTQLKVKHNFLPSSMSNKNSNTNWDSLQYIVSLQFPWDQKHQWQKGRAGVLLSFSFV